MTVLIVILAVKEWVRKLSKAIAIIIVMQDTTLKRGKIPPIGVQIHSLPTTATIL